MSNTFKGTYKVDDGYVGKSRPQYFEIDSAELTDDMTDEEILDLYEESAMEAFQQETTYYTEDSDKFLAWAREQLATRKEEES